MCITQTSSKYPSYLSCSMCWTELKMYADIPQDGAVATEWRGPFWEQKFWDSVVDCPKGWGQMLAQLGSEGYANVTGALLRGCKHINEMFLFWTQLSHLLIITATSLTVSVQQHDSWECYQSQWGRAAETLSREAAGNRPHAASAWDQNSAPAGGASTRNIRVLKLAWRKKNHDCFYVDSGSAASTQRGREDGHAGWITVPALPPLC